MIQAHPDKIFNLTSRAEFEKTALEIYNYQASGNRLYSDFIKLIGKGNDPVNVVSELPFLPVEFFKSHKILTGAQDHELVFESSRTTGKSVSRHYVANLSLYEESFLRCFRLFYGDPEDYLIAALLPSYTEREGSSLVYMMNSLIIRSSDSFSGFYSNNRREMLKHIENALAEKRKVLLMGVSFALLDLAEEYSPDLKGVIVMETGGMKGRRKEIIREELHSILKESFNIDTVHSEYGMTELLSQAYSKGDGIFYCPPWMNVMLRDPQDPLTLIDEPGRTGGINIIDLANINSCSFIATADLGRLHEDGSFEVIGRFDSSDIRGCNLLVE